MPSLKDELLDGITKVKKELYPLLDKSIHLNESARTVNIQLKQAWELLEAANEAIKARADEHLPPIQRIFR